MRLASLFDPEAELVNVTDFARTIASVRNAHAYP